jgi:hypothetical protein
VPNYARHFLTWSIISRPLVGEPPSIDLGLGHHKANKSPLLQLLLSRTEDMIGRVLQGSRLMGLFRGGRHGHASRTTGQPKTTLSRHARELEEGLGARLIERLPRLLGFAEDSAVLPARTAGLASVLGLGFGAKRGGVGAVHLKAG